MSSEIRTVKRRMKKTAVGIKSQVPKHKFQIAENQNQQYGLEKQT